MAKAKELGIVCQQNDKQNLNLNDINRKLIVTNGDYAAKRIERFVLVNKVLLWHNILYAGPVDSYNYFCDIPDALLASYSKPNKKHGLPLSLYIALTSLLDKSKKIGELFDYDESTDYVAKHG